MFSKDTLLSLLGDLSSAQESIEKVSVWLQQYKEDAADIVLVWKTYFLEVSKEKKLNLLYLVNDVIQNSKRKGPHFVEAFGHILPKCLAECRDHEHKDQIQRMLDIWESREIFHKHVMSAMKYNIDDIGMTNATVELADLMNVVDQLIELESQSSEVLTKLSIRLDATDFANAFNVTSRKEGDKYAADFDETANFLDDYCTCLSKQTRKRIEMLQKVNTTLYQMEKDEESLHHLDRESKFKQSELVRTRKAISSRLMMIEEGMVDFGDDSPKREEIENLTSEEEDVDIEGIETSDVNKTKKGVSVLHSNDKLKDDPYDDDGILPEDAIDEQQPKSVRPKKPKKQQKKLPSYEPRKILSYGFRLDAPPNHEQAVGFLLLPDGTVCPAPIADHMFLPKPGTPQPEAPTTATPEGEEASKEESNIPDQGPKTPEGSEPEEGEVSESDEDANNEEKLDTEDVDGEPFDILQDGYISDEDKENSSIGSAPSMPSPEVSEDDDPQASSIKNVSEWKQSTDPEEKEAEELPQDDNVGIENDSDTEEEVQIKPKVGLAAFLDRLSDNEADDASQITEEDTSEYNQFYPPGYLNDQPEKQITTNKPAYLVTSNKPRRDSLSDYRENHQPVNTYYDNRYPDARYDDPHDDYSTRMHPSDEDRNFRDYDYHSNGYRPQLQRPPYRENYRYRRPPQRPPPPRSYYYPHSQRPFRNSCPTAPTQRYPPNYFLWVSPRVIQGMAISGGIIRLFVIYYSTMAVSVVLVYMAIQRLHMNKKEFSLPSKESIMHTYVYDGLSFNINVYMMHNSGKFHKSVDARSRPPFSDSVQNYTGYSDNPEPTHRDNDPTYIPTQQYSSNNRSNLSSESENHVQKYGPPIPKMEEVSIQKYPPSKKLFGPPVPPTQRQYNYSKAVPERKETNSDSDMSESHDEDDDSTLENKDVPFSTIPKPRITFYTKNEPFSDIPASKLNIKSESPLTAVRHFKPFDVDLLNKPKFKPFNKGLDIRSFPKSIAGKSLPGHTNIDSILEMYNMNKSDEEDSDIDDSIPSILQTVFGGERRGCPNYDKDMIVVEHDNTEKTNVTQTTQKDSNKGTVASKREPTSPKNATGKKRKKKSNSTSHPQSEAVHSVIPIQSYSTPGPPATPITNSVLPVTPVPSLLPDRRGVNISAPGIQVPGLFMPRMPPPGIIPPGIPGPSMPIPRLHGPRMPVQGFPQALMRMPAAVAETSTEPVKKLEGKELEDARAAAKARVLQKIAELKAENEKEKLNLGTKTESLTVSHAELKLRIDSLKEDRLSKTITEISVNNSTPTPKREITVSSLSGFYQHAITGNDSRNKKLGTNDNSNHDDGVEPLPPGILPSFFPPVVSHTLPQFSDQQGPYKTNPVRPNNIRPSYSAKPSISKPRATMIANHKLILAQKTPSGNNIPPPKETKCKVTSDQMKKVMKLKAQIDESCKKLKNEKLIQKLDLSKKSRFDVPPKNPNAIVNPKSETQFSSTDNEVKANIPQQKGKQGNSSQQKGQQADNPQQEQKTQQTSVDLDDIDNLVDFSQGDVDLEF